MGLASMGKFCVTASVCRHYHHCCRSHKLYVRGRSLALTVRLSFGFHRTQYASIPPKAGRRLRLRRRTHSKRSPRLVPSSGEGRGGGPTAQPSGPVARSAQFTQPAARRTVTQSDRPGGAVHATSDQRGGSHNATSGRRQRQDRPTA